MSETNNIELQVQGGEQPEIHLQVNGLNSKADKVAGATAGNFAGLDETGNLTDSGYKAADFATAEEIGTVPSGQTVEGQISALNANLTQLSNSKADMIVVSDSTEEAVKSFSDGGNDYQMSLVVGIEPVQDLHGLDNPYPPGGGVNRFNVETITDNAYVNASGGVTTNMSEFYCSDYIPCLPETPYYTNTNVNGRVDSVKFFDGSKGYISGQGASGVFTTPANCYFVRVNGIKEKILAANVCVNYPSSVTAWTPYSNICPISGHTGCNVWDDPAYAGLVEWNQLIKEVNSQNFSFESGVTGSFDNGVCSFTSPSANYGIKTGAIKGIIPGHRYLICLTGKAAESGTSNVAVIYGNTGGTTKTFSLGTTFSRVGGVVPASVNASGGTVYVAATSAGVNKQIDIKDLVIFDLTDLDTLGSTIGNQTYTMEVANVGSGVEFFRTLFPSDYYATDSGTGKTVSEVNGNPYRHIEVTFPTPPGTVYGGTLTVNKDGTGTLVVDRASITMDGTQSLGFNGVLSYGGAQITTTPTPIKKAGIINTYGILCDRFDSKADNVNRPFHVEGRTTNSNIYFNMPENVTTVQEATTWFTNNPTQVSYLLATPVTYQLTNQQVGQIKSLLGVNNLWASTGNIKAVSYSADTKLYIDNKLAALLASLQ